MAPQTGQLISSAKLAAPNVSIFRSGDIRGRYPDQVSESMAFALGCFLSERLGARASVALARDTRASGGSLFEALVSGLSGSGHQLIDLGVVPKEVASYALIKEIADLAVVVTASHHPAGMNGFKILEQPGTSKPQGDVIQAFSHWLPYFDKRDQAPTSEAAMPLDLSDQYADWLIAQLPLPEVVSPLLVCGLGGTAASVADPLIKKLGWKVTKNQWIRGALPEEGPDPRLPGNRQLIQSAIAEADANWAVAWDGDCDRCVFFDRAGHEIATPYLNQILIESLPVTPSLLCVTDGRSVFNAETALARRGGHLQVVESGSVWVRRAMMASGAAYGMESSSHHYFSELSGFDSGFLTFLKTVSALERWGGDVEVARDACREDARCLAEMTIIDLSVDQAVDCLEKGFGRFRQRGSGTSSQVVFSEADDWRVSLQASKTESALRVNVETKNPLRSIEALGEEFLASMGVAMDKAAAPSERRLSRHALIAL